MAGPYLGPSMPNGWQPVTGYHTEFFGHNSPTIEDNSLKDLFSQVFQEEKSLQQQVWDREDSAYQRMVADMQKAGLNPWTGISSGGLSTSVSNGSPTASAFEAFIKGAEYNQRSMNQENHWTDQLLGKLVSLAKIIGGVGAWNNV